MKKISLILLVSLWTSIVPVQAGMVLEFINEVNKICPKTNALIVKKVLLEMLNQKTDCSGNFTQKMMSSCSEVKCDELQASLESVKEKYSGTIIGR